MSWIVDLKKKRKNPRGLFLESSLWNIYTSVFHNQKLAIISELHPVVAHLLDFNTIHIITSLITTNFSGRKTRVRILVMTENI